MSPKFVGFLEPRHICGACFEGDHEDCTAPERCECRCHDDGRVDGLRWEDREDPRVDTAKAERHPVEDEIDEPWEDR